MIQSNNNNLKKLIKMRLINKKIKLIKNRN